jgi:ribosomal protein L37AE/L43A
MLGDGERTVKSCPVCESVRVYRRTKDKNYLCIHCKTVFKNPNYRTIKNGFGKKPKYISYQACRGAMHD